MKRVTIIAVLVAIVSGAFITQISLAALSISTTQTITQEIVEVARPIPDPNRFIVIMSFGYDRGRYINEDDNTLRFGIEVVGSYDGVGYKLVILKGCKVERLAGKRLHCLYLKDIAGSVLTFTIDNVSFSEACILYTTKGELTLNMWGRLVTDSDWIEVGTFTSIVDGEAHLE